MTRVSHWNGSELARTRYPDLDTLVAGLPWFERDERGRVSNAVSLLARMHAARERC